MSAPKENVNALEKKRPQIKKLGLLAGGGALPSLVLEACALQNIEAFIVAFDGQTDPDLTQDRPHLWSRLGAVNTILKRLKKENISDLVLIGSVKRPSLAELRPDLKAASFLLKAGVAALGDDGFLKALRGFLENEGFQIHGAHELAQELLTPEGTIGQFSPKPDHQADIKRGLEVLRGMGPLDVGQAVIVQEGIVLGVEAAEGTDALIARCQSLHRKGRGGVLVKMCKTGQDLNLDLPTIGPQSIELAAQTGLSGIAIHADHSFLIQKQKVAEIADQHKLFVVGIHFD